MDPIQNSRAQMVEHLRIAARISQSKVLDAFAKVPRHLFVPESHRHQAYEDRALPLFEQQTISQPTMIALMLDGFAYSPGHRALEVGAGCGYAAALLAQLVDQVVALELRPALVELARSNLARAGITNVEVHQADGTKGWPGQAPYDQVLVSAAASKIPQSLLEQLAPGGHIVIPVEDRFGQTLRVGVRRGDGGMEWARGVACVFVPLVS